ncbi:MAG: tRNA (N(6)-L-threonylcarbamoyladenosine(37)-C(2))-methylthiotransferase MtaB [Lachnospiraceae bacterium]|nr:tRNA (N(6)-L-threonylcarbamoyladenosine(37)-C(2))-methylthiotransferase MtaB [Lachnospiraceae bacterium]
MKSVALHNLGCKVNSYEMDVMQQMLQEKGYKIVPFDEVADIYIINTCTVTNIADRKSRQMIHRAKKCNPDAVVVAVGCYVQTGEDSVRKDDSIDLAIGNNRKKDLVSILEEYLRGCENRNDTRAVTSIIDINHTDEYEEMTLTKTAEHTRAYIKIQDGCNQFCSYCIIPYARGRVRSRREEDILKEVHGIVAAGYREIVLTGIHISSYGVDRGAPELLRLLERLHDTDGLERIRLGSLEPRIVTEEFAQRISAIPKICPHFHLSLQSGCDSVLRRMNRRYTSGEYFQTTEVLRKYYQDPAITTDVIVGFPQETEEEFRATEEFVRKVNFYEMHIFKYSKRQGTRAAAMEGQITEAEKGRRSTILSAAEQEMSRAYRTSRLGREDEVLFEEKKVIDGVTYWIGHTPQYIRAAKEAVPSEDLGNRIIRGTLDGFVAEDIMLLK